MSRDNQQKFSRRKLLRSASAASLGIGTVGTVSGGNAEYQAEKLNLTLMSQSLK